MRRDYTEHKAVYGISYIQFSKRYTPTSIPPKDKAFFKPNEFVKGSLEFKKYSNLDFIITHDFEARVMVHQLPKYIEIQSPLPGEPRYVKLRKSYVARLHKFNRIKNPHEFFYSELQLYHPFHDERLLHPDSLDNCQALYDDTSVHNGLRKISNVKCILMEHLETVEEGNERAMEMVESNAGVILDNAIEQDNADCNTESLEQHEEFMFKCPDDLDQIETSTNLFKKIELYTDEEISKKTLQLDKEQRMVLDIAVNFAKNIVKGRCQMNCVPKAPLLIVQGGAGTGKSTVIDAISQQVEKILRTSGDNPLCPYIIRAAFTGTAAANIMGQTLHNAFSFNFGNEFLTLGDKARDQRRSLLENLQLVIIDEYSMIKSDMLYQLDLRLKELKQKPTLPFGGISVFLFGDILQLRPVRSRYIFEEPLSESYHLSFLLDPLWQKFDVILLTENHRQGED